MECITIFTPRRESSLCTALKPSDNHSAADTVFTVVFDTYKDRIYGFVLSLVKSPDAAEELTQDILIKLWLCRDILGEVKNLDGYIFTVARNKALNHLRKAAYDKRLLQELAGYMRTQHTDVEDQVTLHDYERLVGEAVSSLSPQRKQVYRLSREDGLSLEEIAQQLQLSRNTVKNHLVASLKAIREHLQKHGGEFLVLLMLGNF